MRPKPLTKEKILEAHRHTKSGRAAARYLGCSYQHYKIYAKLYKDDEKGKTLFELHKNQQGKGIPKHLKGSKKDPAIDQIINGTLDPSHFSPDRIKNRLIVESYLVEECCRCGFNERRLLDYKVPLLLHFKDKNKYNYKLENLELLCYNCYFLYIGNVFSQGQEEQIQDFTIHKNNRETTWDLSEEDYENMKALGLL